MFYICRGLEIAGCVTKCAHCRHDSVAQLWPSSAREPLPPSSSSAPWPSSWSAGPGWGQVVSFHPTRCSLSKKKYTTTMCQRTIFLKTSSSWWSPWQAWPWPPWPPSSRRWWTWWCPCSPLPPAPMAETTSLCTRTHKEWSPERERSNAKRQRQVQQLACSVTDVLIKCCWLFETMFFCRYFPF